MGFNSGFKESMQILKARVKRSADFKRDWYQMAETQWITLKFTDVEMRLSDDVKPTISERLCDFNIKKNSKTRV